MCFGTNASYTPTTAIQKINRKRRSLSMQRTKGTSRWSQGFVRPVVTIQVLVCVRRSIIITCERDDRRVQTHKTIYIYIERETILF